MKRIECEGFDSIEKTLKQVKSIVPEIPRERKENYINQLLKMEMSEQKRGTLWDFVKDQVSFMNRFVIVAQLVWGILFVMAFHGTEIYRFTNGELCLLSMAPPLLLLLVVEEIARVYNKSMLEIECATKFSIRKLILVRMLFVSVGNLFVLFIALVTVFPYLQESLRLGFSSLLLYGLTPLVLMTWMILLQMEKRSGEQLLYGTGVCYVILLIIGLLGGKESVNIYRAEFRGAWILTLIIGILACIWQFKRINNELENYNLVV